MLYPLIFRPRFKERIWGGRKLETLYHKRLPQGVPIGESWEISDRAGDESVIANGPLAGRDLRWVMEHHSSELLGGAASQNGRFPLLVKILDAQATLSLQVHPPADKAAQLGGEPKTEMWFVADAEPGAELFVGLRRGVTRAEFERRIKDGSVAECFHRAKVGKGDAMFLPSGRVHALGAGQVIFEIQQNSDTTYRVFDWNRVGADGKPRALHIPESLASIDFGDFEPGLLPGAVAKEGEAEVRPMVQDSLFAVEHLRLAQGGSHRLKGRTMHILGVLSGSLSVGSGTDLLALHPGEFGLVPACLDEVVLRAGAGTEFLRVQAGT